MLNFYLHQTDLRRRAQNVFSSLNVIAEYERIRKMSNELMQKAVDEIRNLDFSLYVNITYDNFEHTEKVNEIKIDDNKTFVSTITVFANIKHNMSENDLK